MMAKYAKAKDHAEEVAEFFATLDECATAIFHVIHKRHAAAPQAALAALPAPAPIWTTAKPSAELKPEKLSHDATMATFRTCKKQFRAYYDAGSIGSLPCTQQQAYLNNCVDEALRSRICLLYTSPSPRDRQKSRMPSSA